MNDLIYLLTGKPFPLPGQNLPAPAAPGTPVKIANEKRAAMRNEKKDLLMRAVADGGHTVTEMRRSIGTSRGWARLLANELVKEGRLIRNENGKQVTYVLP